MLTGDNLRSATAIATHVGIDVVHAAMLAHQLSVVVIPNGMRFLRA